MYEREREKEREITNCSSLSLNFLHFSPWSVTSFSFSYLLLHYIKQEDHSEYQSQPHQLLFITRGGISANPSVHSIPSFFESLDGSRAKGNGYVQWTVHVIVFVTFPGNLDQVLNDHGTGWDCLLAQDLSAHPGGHLFKDIISWSHHHTSNVVVVSEMD